MRIVYGKRRSRHKVRFEQGPHDEHFVHVLFVETPKAKGEPERLKHSYWILDSQMARFREMMAKEGLTLESEE
jgi:hypothetical protein